MKLKTLVPIFALLSLPLSVVAAPVTYPGPTAVDDTGAVVTPTSISVASVTDLDGNAISTPGAVAHIAGPNTSAVYDAAAKGEAWITLTPVMAGHTFVNSPPRIYASVDPQQTAKIATNAADSPNEITAQGQAAKISTNAMDSPNEVAAQTQATSNGAALVTANAGITSANTGIAALPAANATAVWGAGTKTITGGTVTTVTSPITLPATAPATFLSADATVAGLPASVWLYTASDGLTHQQSDALRTAVLLRGFSVAYNATTRTQVTSYFKADNSTVLATTTVVYDLTGRPATRTTAFTNLP